MKTIHDKKFKGETVSFDDTCFIRCSFENCTMLYAGGDYSMEKCSWVAGNVFKMLGAADRTCTYMRTFGLKFD